MKTLLALLAGLWLASASTPASAEDERLVQGTFCSAAAANRVWAFYYSYNNVFYNCAQVRQSLQLATRAPITQWNRGYYWINGVNAVQVRCGLALSANRYFTGVGAFPLQQAYNYANAYWGQSCIFYVN